VVGEVGQAREVRDREHLVEQDLDVAIVDERVHGTDCGASAGSLGKV